MVTKSKIMALIGILILVLGACGPSAEIETGPSTPPAQVSAADTALPSATPIPPAPTPASPTEAPTDMPEAGGLSADEIATLSSLTQVDDYPLYTMHYQGAYNREQASLERSGATVWACSLFAALGDAGSRLYGRNFDWDFSPALLLFTDPPEGYASVSMVDIAYLGFDGTRSHSVADLPFAEREALLYAPFIPFDGLNEHGLAIGMAAVPPGDVPPDPDKETIDSVGIIREMLDHARDVDEALAILQSYNIDMGGGPPIHYLLADASGRSLLVELYQGETHVLPNEKPWHQATNFLRASVGDDAAGQCWRYDKISEQLAEPEGRLTAAEAMDLLSGVAQPGTQWSVVYGLSSGDVQVVMGGEYDSAHTFHLDLAAAPASEVDRLVAGLKGLSLDEFFDESYKQLLLRDPQYLTYLGLSEEFGLRNDRLNNLSDAYIRETKQLEAAILDQLRTYDQAELTPEQQVSYDVYEWYLDNRVRGHEFMYHNYTLHQFLGSYQDELLRLFTEIQPIEDWEDAEDYIARLSQVDDQVAQLLEGLQIREKLGVIPPSVIVEFTLRDLRDMAGRWARNTPFYTIFEEKLGAMEGLSDDEKLALLAAAEQEIENSVLPAYQALVEYLEHVQPLASDDIGVWKLPDGDAYYAYLLRDQTSTDLSAQQIHDLGLAEVARIQAEMRQVFDELGYPQDASLGELMGRAAHDAGSYNTNSQSGKEQVVAAYEALLDGVDQHLDEVFNIRPQARVEVVGDLSFGGGGGFYVPASLDGSRPGAFHTGVGGGQVAKYRMPSAAYHEAIPGHHFQIAIAQELDLPFFRTDLFFNGYAEGWALYAEQLAWEMGLYEDDPYGNLGRLQLELLRAVRLVTDTGIHAQRWTRTEAKIYMNEALGDPGGGLSGEVDRYIVLPAQATGYKVGMLKILELRQQAMDELGDQFDLKEFHHVVLGNGALPLEILERLVDEYIAAQKSQPLAKSGYTPVFEPAECRFDVPAGYAVECGDLVVPQDRSQPTGPTVKLHVAIFASTNPSPRPDPVIHLVGGPGGNLLDSSDFYLNAGGDRILETRDYVLFNQRGTRYAEPSLECPGIDEFRRQLAEQDLDSRERETQENGYLLGCHNDLLNQGIDLAAYNSAENAADVNDLRIALGYDVVNLYGISYGTRLALTVMRDYPEGIRSVIIDSVFPPQVALDSELAPNAHRAFTTLFAGCAADASCNAQYPNLKKVFYQVVDKLNANPATVTVREGTLAARVDGGVFLDSIFGSLYRADAIPWIPLMIYETSKGNYEALRYPLEVRFDESGISSGMYYSLECREEVAFESYEDSLARAVGLPPQVTEHFASPSVFTLCQTWQSGQADPVENKAVVSDIPTLVLSGQYDPITPPAWGRLAAETLSNSFFYEFPGIGHGVMRSNACGLDIGLQFLDDPTTEPDTSCLDDLAAPDFQ